MRKNSLIVVSFFLLLTSCGGQGSSESPGASTTNSETITSDRDVLIQELRVLQAETPAALNLESYYKDLGYNQWPTRLFADKINPNSSAHYFLQRLGKQIYQQALMADKSGEQKYANNSLTLIRSLTDSHLAFINNPAIPNDTNDNRFLEIAWFLSHVARGARILDMRMSEGWKAANDWSGAKDALNNWIGLNVNQNWDIKDALNQSPLNLAGHAGTMNWVGSRDSGYGSSNRTFAMLESLMRVAEFRNGKLGPMNLNANAWLAKTEHDGSIANIFQLFRGYLSYYFYVPLNSDPNQFKLNYKRDATGQISPGVINNNPQKLNIDDCPDPSEFGYQAKCLLNKDAYRNDTYHPQMGLASILHIIDIARRWGMDLSREEHEKIIMGLRWASFNNTPGVTGKDGAYDIALWELAFRFYKAQDLGPYCERDLKVSRSQDKYKKAGLAWGYSRVAIGY
jgi:hypothetical protein